ncbi:UvrD-helicase domain-containing protein [Neiella marina]|uniref:DNA 3'-5' helicase n=1 Tax=Neiella holothuriorum TaxID=2870530 RepID=A0ABS7EHQ1_9GAMM|nr:UvrD-helicase domain-containing protein [Neiella holothuriorum]MBW8191423.1 UvrD-helicase domain-containing protein [Neiella holothuriorum]
MQFYEYSKFRESIVNLSKKGSSFSKAAKDAEALVGRVALKQDNPLHGCKTTNHGETRIKNCIKYDLCGRSRLVTVQSNGNCLLLFVGDHNAVDAWLNANKGMSFALDKKNQFVEVKSQSSVIGDGTPIVDKRFRHNELLIDLIDENLLDRFLEESPRKVQREIDRLTSFDEHLLYHVTSELDGDYSVAVRDAFLSLISGDIKNAIRVIQLYLGDIKPIEEIDVDSVVVDSEFLKKISPDSAQYPELLRKFAEGSEYKEWMLFMHPDQESVAFSDFNGPAKLLGVSGSGKTCVVIQRAIYLAKKYPRENILVVTLNKPLAVLIEKLVNQMSDEEVILRIEVKPFFAVGQDLLNQFEPNNRKLYEDTTWKSGEHIDEVWREFYRCELGNNDAEVLHEIHDRLISKGVDAENYIKEEFDWIRSALPSHQRNNYLGIPRQGRTIPLNERQRKTLLKGLSAWERKMKMVGVTDYLNISTAVYRHISKVVPKYRSVLIDESQDFGNIEFSIARSLVAENANDIFICGDAAQKISTKYQNLKEAGIDIHGSRSKSITRNYRNSREILELANNVLEENLTEEMISSDDFEVLDPEYASFSGSNPLLLKAKNLSVELSSAFDYLNKNLKTNQKGCICIAGYTHHEIELYAKKIGVSVLTGNVDINEGSLFMSDLEQTKGFEFDYVCILNCSEGVIPDLHLPVEEHFRELSRLYVAMTRAKLELILSFSGTSSPLFSSARDYLIEDTWQTYIDLNMRFYSAPVKMSDVVHIEDYGTASISDMTGSMFLYRKEAIGLSQDLVELLRNRVTGKGARTKTATGSFRVKSWKNIGSLINDLKGMNAYEHKVNPKLIEELEQMNAYEQIVGPKLIEELEQT